MLLPVIRCVHNQAGGECYRLTWKTKTKLCINFKPQEAQGVYLPEPQRSQMQQKALAVCKSFICFRFGLWALHVFQQCIYTILLDYFIVSTVSSIYNSYISQRRKHLKQKELLGHVCKDHTRLLCLCLLNVLGDDLRSSFPISNFSVCDSLAFHHI